MIPNQWYVILESSDVRNNQVIGIKRMGKQMVAWRDSKGKPGVALDKCPHRGIALSKGKLKDDHLQCPFHGFEYDANGKCKLIPANGKSSQVPDHIRANAYAISETNGFIYLWWGDPALVGSAGPVDPASVKLPWFEDLDDKLIHNSFTAHWKAHYSRVIENQLDVVHVPFIHHTTIGRGLGPVVNGPYTMLTGNSLSFWPWNEADRGQKPLRPDEIKEPKNGSIYITFLFPNLWQNHIMDSMRIIVAFVPVDDDNTLMYLRTYQKMVTLPVLKNIYFFFSGIFNRIVLRQDQRVVETHQPMPTQLKMDENLITGDYPIILYRKRREELKTNAGI
jgi:phenylpropionate dioxygenase-like ring-hydroxylating dioxygenase large terminal subunit